MTILSEREALPVYKESYYPDRLIYVRENDQIGVDSYDSTHSSLAAKDRLTYEVPSKFPKGKPNIFVTDAGEIQIKDGLLIISSYISQTTKMQVVHDYEQYTSYEERQNALKNVRRETARILANRTGMSVKIVLSSGEEEIISP